MTVPTWKWFIEYTSSTQAHMHGVKDYIYCGETKYQKVEIINTDTFGRCLILDGKIQSAEADEYIYHESLIHPAMVLHPNPQRIMVVGGGEGAVIREILKHPSVKKVIMVDIDQEVVDLCEKYLPSWSDGAIKDPRVKLYFMDARKYLVQTEETFDIIISDLTEPIDDGPSYLLFTKEFFIIAHNKLAEEGIIALQSGSFNPIIIGCHSAINNTLNLAFNHVCSYAAFIPSYDATWGFNVASKKHSPDYLNKEEIDSCLRERNIDSLKFYDGETHQHMFSIPKDIRNSKEKENRIIEDGKPLFTY